MKRYLIYISLFSFASCNLFHGPKSPYKDFFTRDGITHYRYCDMGSVARKLKKGDMAELVLSYAKMNDSVFWSSVDKGYPHSLFFSYDKLVTGSTYEKEVVHANLGDSVVYIVPADSVFQNILHLPVPHFLGKNDMMMVHVRIKNIMDSAHYSIRLKEIAVYKNSLDMQEQIALINYAKANNIPDTDKHDNVYVIQESPGSGPAIKMGEMVSLSYKGRFLSGKMFDSVGLATPLQFRLGDTAQIVTGLEIGIKTMREGEKAKIIIPSQLAFGNNGSSTGIVPPYTTVIYEVTLLKVQAL